MIPKNYTPDLTHTLINVTNHYPLSRQLSLFNPLDQVEESSVTTSMYDDLTGRIKSNIGDN